MSKIKLPKSKGANIDDRAASATATAQRLRGKQRVKKIVTAAVGGAVALTASIGTPTAALTKGPFPTFINDTCGIDGGHKDMTRPLDALDALKNPLKNRFTVPGPSDIDKSVTINDMLGPDAVENSKKLNEQRAATITGYIVHIKSGGAETCNCQTDDDQFYDSHIFVSPDPKVDPKDTSHAIVVEMTPRIRKLLRSNSNEWDTDTLENAYPPGTKVTITGWLFFDKEHWVSAMNNPAHGSRVWRGSCWEIHPVTNIEAAK